MPFNPSRNAQHVAKRHAHFENLDKKMIPPAKVLATPIIVLLYNICVVCNVWRLHIKNRLGFLLSSTHRGTVDIYVRQCTIL